MQETTQERWLELEGGGEMVIKVHLKGTFGPVTSIMTLWPGIAEPTDVDHCDATLL
jgi:hypothetical protein